MPRKKYVACTKCRRILHVKSLRKEGNRLVCPYCGNTRFSEHFSNIVLVLDPERSYVAKKLNITERGLYALTIEL